MAITDITRELNAAVLAHRSNWLAEAAENTAEAKREYEKAIDALTAARSAYMGAHALDGWLRVFPQHGYKMALGHVRLKGGNGEPTAFEVVAAGLRPAEGAVRQGE